MSASNHDFDWEKAKSFRLAAKLGSFTKAAKVLKLAAPTLGRQISALEDELGVVLFEKIGRNMKLTPSGEELLSYVNKMSEAAAELALIAEGKSLDLDGKVTITASEAYAVYILPDLLKKLKNLQPKILVEVLSTNNASDLMQREADIALRNFQPTEPDLIAKNVGDGRFSFYASNEYIKQNGLPKSKEELSHCKFIGFSNYEHVIKDLGQHGLKLTLKNFPFLVNSHMAHWEMVKKGMGIGFMEDSIGDKDPDVTKILPELFQDMVVPNWLVSHRDLKHSHKIRYVFDFLSKELALKQ